VSVASGLMAIDDFIKQFVMQEAEKKGKKQSKQIMIEHRQLSK